MPSSIALSLSVGVLSGIATWLVLGPLSAFLLLWAAFIGWGCFFHSGGTMDGLKSGAIGNVFGVICAVITAMLIFNVNLGALTAAIWVGVVVIGLVYIGATVSIMGNIPAAVYGFASTFAYVLQTPDKFTADAIMPAAILVVSSLIVGQLFGFASGTLAGKLTKS
ncbi:MAG: hypothetical protein COB22_03585 [Cycloclasticus sp.]|nr:MAG: hypothetical protein COB22_03585 [Cycloclasticus sp.]